MNFQRRTFDAWQGKGRGDGFCVAYLSTYPPRECGIATFCQDLVMGVTASGAAGEPIVLAMENATSRASYAAPVQMTVDDRSSRQYQAAADFINDSLASVVCLQHEFGIYGGVDEPSLYGFLQRLEKPLISILHTISPRPARPQRELIRTLARRSDRVVVMNALARAILASDYGISSDKVAFIHHGSPFFPRDGADCARAKLGLAGRLVLSTFGLISRGKGIEYMLDAMPAVVARHPEALYLLIGKTHPGVQLHERESYRDELLHRVRELGMENHVRFVNRYLSKPEIIDYLCATDVYVSPYLNPEQIVSGTLAYAMAAGKAIVSTPYLYARFLLDEGRGILVGFRDSDALAAAISRLLDSPQRRHAMEALNYEYGKDLLWPRVGQQYLSLFRGALAEQMGTVAAPPPAPYASASLLKGDANAGA